MGRLAVFLIGGEATVAAGGRRVVREGGWVATPMDVPPDHRVWRITFDGLDFGELHISRHRAPALHRLIGRLLDQQHPQKARAGRAKR